MACLSWFGLSWGKTPSYSKDSASRELGRLDHTQLCLCLTLQLELWDLSPLTTKPYPSTYLPKRGWYSISYQPLLCFSICSESGWGKRVLLNKTLRARARDLQGSPRSSDLNDRDTHRVPHFLSSKLLSLHLVLRSLRLPLSWHPPLLAPEFPNTAAHCKAGNPQNAVTGNPRDGLQSSGWLLKHILNSFLLFWFSFKKKKKNTKSSCQSPPLSHVFLCNIILMLTMSYDTEFSLSRHKAAREF